MTFMQMSKSPASAPRLLNTLQRKLPGEVVEKFQIFSDTPRIMRVFDSGGCRLPARSRPQLADVTFA